MAGGFQQYLKDTKSELNHVAWPTRTQTVVYTVLVAVLSVGVALYLGLFDFLFTSGLTRAVQIKAAAPSSNPITVTPEVATSSDEAPQATFGIPGAKTNNQ